MGVGSPYYYGYSLQASRGTFSGPQAHRIQAPSYLYYPTQMEGSFPAYPTPTPPPPHPHPPPPPPVPPTLQPTSRPPFFSSTGKW